MLFLRQFNIEVGFNGLILFSLVIALAAASCNAIPTRVQYLSMLYCVNMLYVIRMEVSLMIRNMIIKY